MNNGFLKKTNSGKSFDFYRNNGTNLSNIEAVKQVNLSKKPLSRMNSRDFRLNDFQMRRYAPLLTPT